MLRDYVRPNKPDRLKKPQKKVKYAGLSRARALTTLIIVVAFIGLLLFLRKDNIPDAKSTKASEANAEQNTQAQPIYDNKSEDRTNDQTDTNPSSNKPIFDFYNILPDAQMETIQEDVYLSTPKELAKATLFWLQTDSFRKSQDAENRRVQLILLNITNVSVKKSTNDNSTWYKVRIGPYNNLTQLDKIKQQLAVHDIDFIEVKREP